jgi:hypothetical protein
MNADDYKRIIVLVRWDRGEGSRFSHPDLDGARTPGSRPVPG